MRRRFEWDESKAQGNYRKHGVTFEEAALVFRDPFARTRQDRIENSEQRWQTIGRSGEALLLMVAHALWFENEDVEVVRIISARRLQKKERKYYENG